MTIRHPEETGHPQTGRATAREPNDYLLYALLALVLLAPLPLASNRPLPAALVALAAGLLLAWWSIRTLRQGVTLPVPLAQLQLPLALFGFTCVWILIQWSPWTPVAWHHPVWQQTADVLGTPIAGRITVNPDATMTTFMHLLSYAAIFWLGLQLNAQRSAAQQSIIILIAGGSLYALYGLIIYLSGNQTVLIFQKWAYHSSLTSTFVNRNSYATYTGLCLIAAVGLMVHRIQPILRMPGPRRRKTAELVDYIFGKETLLSIAIVILASTLMLTLSRAGFFTSILGVATTFFLMLGMKYFKKRQGLVIVGAVILVMLGIFMLSGDEITERYLQEDALVTENARWPVYRLILTAIGDAPFWGTGYGTFPDIFTGYRDTYVTTVGVWDKAHNTYLENMLELGLPAALSLNAAIALLAWQALQGARRRRRGRLYPAIAAGATLTVGLHALVDFSLQIPAVALTYALLLGIGVAHSRRHQEVKQETEQIKSPAA